MAMGNFEVRGVTWVYWTMNVQALDEEDAAQESRRIGSRVEIPSMCAEISARHHCVFDSRELFVEEQAS